MLRSLAVPRLWLLLLTLATALACTPVWLRIHSTYRYVEWAATDRDMLDSSLFTLPVIIILCMVVARRAFAEGLIWQLPHQRRAAASALRVMTGLSVAAMAGTLIGWIPVLVWGSMTATSGHPSLINLLSTVIWAGTAAALSTAITALTRSIWPSIALGCAWVLCYQVGRTTDAGSGMSGGPRTHVGALPFDGIFLTLGAPWAQHPAIPFLRLTGGLLVFAAAVVMLWNGLGEAGTKRRLSVGLGNLPVILIAAVLIGVSVVNAPVMTRTQAPMACAPETVETVRVCLYESHSTDLPLVAGVVEQAAESGPDPGSWTR